LRHRGAIVQLLRRTSTLTARARTTLSGSLERTTLRAGHPAVDLAISVKVPTGSTPKGRAFS